MFNLDYVFDACLCSAVSCPSVLSLLSCTPRETLVNVGNVLWRLVYKKRASPRQLLTFSNQWRSTRSPVSRDLRCGTLEVLPINPIGRRQIPADWRKKQKQSVDALRNSWLLAAKIIQEKVLQRGYKKTKQKSGDVYYKFTSHSSTQIESLHSTMYDMDNLTGCEIATSRCPCLFLFFFRA